MLRIAFSLYDWNLSTRKARNLRRISLEGRLLHNLILLHNPRPSIPLLIAASFLLFSLAAIALAIFALIRIAIIISYSLLAVLSVIEAIFSYFNWNRLNLNY